jgi:REP element-mobilizing transposase RayT
MPQSLAQIYLHLVFSTKDRIRFFQNLPFREMVHAYLAGACRNLDCPPLIVGGVEDHVHILCKLGKTTSVSILVRELKRESSKWVKEQSRDLQSFYWQMGYGAFSISPGHVDILTAYITDQEEHHKTETFQDEFRRLLQKYKIEYDERYVWE